MAHMSEHLTAASDSAGFYAGSRLHSLGRAAKLASIFLVLPLSACGLNKVSAPPEVAYDYRDRHPIVLAEVQNALDVFPPPVGARLDNASYLRIREFVARYQKLGQGKITVLAPAGGAYGSGRHGLEEIRRALVSAGADRSIYVSEYPVTDPSMAAPVRLSFVGLKPKVKGGCGEWPDDLASGASLEGWQNKTYWNYGCATQATLSAQIADPRDLASPRGETPADIETRMRAISDVRKGTDPSTKWVTKSTSISDVGGN
jgi:pilus assembly protein CpaD